jgi:xylulokinase
MLIGLDLGTTTIKAVTYDPALGRVGAVAARPTPVSHPQPGYSEHDPEALWATVGECLREVLAKDPGQAVAGLAIASFAEAGLPLDGEMQPLYPIIAWYDRRCEPQAAWWDTQFSDAELHAITGQQSSPSFGVNKWLWLRENRPEVARRTAKWLSANDYILYRLSGEQATDYSLASRTQMFDQRRLNWSPEILGLARLSMEQLPCPRPAGTRVGRVTSEAAHLSGVPEGTPCVLGGHDHLCASFAAGAYGPGMVADSSGTAEAVAVALPAFQTSAALAQASYACYAHVAPGQYVLKGGLKLSGGAVDWLARLLAGLEPGLPYAQLLARAEIGVGRRAGPLWLPHWLGSGTPEGDRHSLAALVGVRAEHDQGDVFRGLLESLAFWLRHNLEEMQRLSGQTTGPVAIIGGTVRLGLLTQLKADVLNRPVSVPELPEGAAIGAALLAGLGTGIFADPAEAIGSLRYGKTEVTPDPAHAAWYDALYRESYLPLYAALRVVNEGLGRLQRGESRP